MFMMVILLVSWHGDRHGGLATWKFQKESIRVSRHNCEGIQIQEAS